MNLKNSIVRKKLFIRLIVLVIALFITALYYNLFLVENNLVVGGSGGLAIIINRWFGIKNFLSIFIISFVTFVLAYIFLGKEEAFSVIASTIIFPIFVEITSTFPYYIDVSIDSMLVIVIISAILSGITSSMILKVNFSNAGISTICLILSKKLKTSYGKVSFIINSLIVLLGGAIFGIDKVIYAVIFLFIESFVINKVVLGISTSKTFYIVTDKQKSIEKYIIKVLNQGITMLDAHSAKSGKDKNVIMCIVPTNKYFLLKEGIKKIDEEAFVLITDAYEMYGGTIKVNKDRKRRVKWI